MANRSSGSEICAEVRLSIEILYAAGGVVWESFCNFGISSAESYKSGSRTTDVIINKKKSTWNLSDTDRLRELQDVCSYKSRLNALRGTVGAIYGCIISQKT